MPMSCFNCLWITDGIQEVCYSDIFQPRYWKSEVIVMKSAMYGRMKIGRCIKQEPILSETTLSDKNFLGCSENILGLADQKCSGRSECDIRPSDLDSQTLTSCYSFLKLYLEASYECVKGLFSANIIVL